MAFVTKSAFYNPVIRSQERKHGNGKVALLWLHIKQDIFFNMLFRKVGVFITMKSVCSHLSCE